MKLKEILHAKGTKVHTTTPDVLLQRVVEQLVENNCGSLVVVEPNAPRVLVGIITERDIMRSCAAGKSLQTTRVAEVMTVEVTIGHIADSVSDTMGLLTRKRIRHLPVVEDGKIAGMISIGDVVKAQHDAVTAENHHLKHYIHDSGVLA